jgi:hypothetical protein
MYCDFFSNIPKIEEYYFVTFQADGKITMALPLIIFSPIALFAVRCFAFFGKTTFASSENLTFPLARVFSLNFGT